MDSKQTDGSLDEKRKSLSIDNRSYVNGALISVGGMPKCISVQRLYPPHRNGYNEIEHIFMIINQKNRFLIIIKNIDLSKYIFKAEQ